MMVFHPETTRQALPPFDITTIVPNDGAVADYCRFYHLDFDNDFYSLSGYYLFDALWVKINSVWNYILALFDLQSNTIVSYDLAHSESEKSIYNFLSESTYNQDRNYIVTDLKHEYRQPIR